MIKNQTLENKPLVRNGSLFTDPLFALQSPSSAGDKTKTAGDLLTASADVFEKKEKKNKTSSVVYRLR